MEINKKIFQLEQKKLKKFLLKLLQKSGYTVYNHKGFLYAPGDIPILLCAHMDTVHKEVPTVFHDNNGYISSPQGIGGDDRCGVQIITEIISEGLKPHILFTEDEELGCVGAELFSLYLKEETNFASLKSDISPVNFIIELDRRGDNDAVYYSCGTPELEEMISRYGFVTQQGSYSDIVEIAPALGVAAVNLSAGYYSEHTLEEYISLKDMENTKNRVIQILKNEANTRYEYIEYFENERYSLYNEYFDLSQELPQEFVVPLCEPDILIDRQGNICDFVSDFLYVDVDGDVYVRNAPSDPWTITVLLRLKGFRAYTANGKAKKADFDSKDLMLCYVEKY